MDQSQLIAALIGAVVGAILTTFISAYLTRMQARTTFSFDMHRELNSETMMVHRTKSQRILAKYCDERLDVLIRRIPNDLHSVWLMTGFYDRLLVGIEHGQIKKDVMAPLFGELFCFFYFGFFEKQLVPLHWDISKKMNDLMVYFKSNTNIVEWEHWVKNAKFDAQAVINEVRPGRMIPLDEQ